MMLTYALPARYHTLPAHLIEIAIVLVIALAVGFVVTRYSGRRDR